VRLLGRSAGDIPSLRRLASRLLAAESVFLVVVLILLAGPPHARAASDNEFGPLDAFGGNGTFPGGNGGNGVLTNGLRPRVLDGTWYEVTGRRLRSYYCRVGEADDGR
jgi:hypothetical protein